jgi:protein-disulfide isomerase
MERKTEVWFIAIFAIIVVLAVVGAAFLSSSTAPNSNFKATTVPALTAADHERGNTTNPKLNLIEYGDFQCPACGQYEPIVEQLTKEYGDRVEFVFRNFPLYQIHQDAMISAQAAEAAALQNKYWEMHDLLYTNQVTWSAEPAATVVAKYFDGYAQSLGLDVAKFDTDINSQAVRTRVQRDIDSGNAAQVDHTPTFFIDLTQIQNPSSYANFKTVLDSALAAQTVATSTSQQ